MSEQQRKKSLTEKLIYDNKILMVLCVLVSVIIWATVKINYSADTVRTVSDIRANLGSTAQELDFIAFIDEEDLLVDVEVTGKAYNINTHALSKDDIIVEASSAFVDSAGYKIVSLTARIADPTAANDFEITKIIPSTLTVFYDSEATRTLNVIACVDKELNSIVKDGFTPGQLVPSLNTVDVTGPATILAKLKYVNFEASLDEKKLPLTSSVELKAEVSYPDLKSNESKFLVCAEVNNETNPATVTLPVYAKKIVPVTVNFINKPEGIKTPAYSISPSKVEIIYNPKDEAQYTELNVGTIDFKKLDNSENEFTIDIDRDKLAVRLTDKELTSFDVSVDMSGYSKTTVSYSVANVMFLNKQDEMVYSLGTGGSLDTITVIGPSKSVSKLTSDDVRIEINVSALNMSRSNSMLLDANITVGNTEITDCWVYGDYKAYVTVMTEEEAQALTTTQAE